MNEVGIQEVLGLVVQRKRLLDGSLCLGMDSFRSSLALLLQMQYWIPTSLWACRDLAV
jgi:hypothetical protein